MKNTQKENQHTKLVNFSSTKAKLILTEQVVNQIKFLCSKIPSVEWSGVLYHTSTGDVDDPKSFVCKAEYILLLDKGTSGYTEYDFTSANFTEALMEKPELMELSMSHVHSHNTMNVFFSGTDNEELTDNAPNYNYYLSLIVNNKGEYCAKVAFIGEIEGRNISFKTKDGNFKNIVTEKSYCTFYHDMDIEVEKNEKVDDFFVSQYEKVIASKPVFSNFNTQTSFDFDKPKYGYGYNKSLATPNHLVASTEIDTEAIGLLKYILRDEKQRHLALLTILKQANLNSAKGIAENKKYIEERFAKADIYFQEFIKDNVSFDDTITLEEMWLRMRILLDEEPFEDVKMSKLIIEELDSWTWK